MAKIVTNNRNTDQGPMIGKLALNYQKITNDQYIRAVAIQKKESESGQKVTLNEVFLKYDFLTREEMKFLNIALDLLMQKRKEKRFGAIAIRQGLLNERDLVAAIETQKTERKRIGNILKGFGALTDAQCDEIISIQKTIVVKLPSYSEIEGRSLAGKTNRPVVFSTVDVNISEDALAAVAVLPEDGRIVDEIEIKKALLDNEICFGEISESEIKENLKYFDLGLTSFIVAKGRKSVPGAPGDLTLHFVPRETEPGTIDEQGKIDFKNRGDIPFVKAGTLLAERNDMTSSIPGKNIFGKDIDIENVEDVAFVCGDGAAINDFGDKIVADNDGEPCLNLDGTISVLSEMVVDNVDYETGNIIFDGNIIVRDSVQSDFEVKGKNLEAGEILGAKINIDGDIDVGQGIIGAEIRANGSIKATFLKNCTIICAGEVIVEKEIIDSEIIAGGSCFVRGGILSSKICTAQSIVAVSIGTGVGGANHLEIGKGAVVAKRLTEKLAKTTYLKGKEIRILLEERDDLIHMISITNSVIKGIRNSHTKNEEELNAVKTLVERMEQKTKKTISTGRQRIKEFETKINSAIETADTLENDKKYVAGKLSELDIQIKNKKAENEKYLRKINTIKDRVDVKRKTNNIRVVNVIAEGTKVCSPNASLVLTNDFSNVTIREVKVYVSSDAMSNYSHKIEIAGKI